MSFNLSKSRFTSAIQCPKMLWLRINKPDEFDESVIDQSVFDAGNDVGDLAMGLFGDFTEVPFGNLSDMLDVTRSLLDNGTRVICEASFASEDGFCSVDILINNGSNSVEIYEVKSSTEVKDIYRYDIAYQYHILTMLGFNVTRACLVHINPDYVRHGELNLQELFDITELTNSTIGMQSEVEERISDIKSYLEQTSEPACPIGMQCFDPYGCGFWGHCTSDLGKPNVFDVRGMYKKTMFKHYQNGIVSFGDLYNSGVLTANQKIQVEQEVYDLPPHIDRAAIKSTLDKLSYPLYFLDFETFSPAIPQYDNCSPFNRIVFQYSLHYIEKEGGELLHKEYLAYPDKDPRRELAERLVEDIPMNVCTTAYNMGFEKGCIRELADLFPDLSEHLMNIHDNIVDLMIPFKDKSYYCKAMEGSYSIKYVLPALFPGDPSLDYHNLEGVHHGGEASATFTKMSQMDKDELETYRGYLLKYCELDTYAMVKIWEKLLEMVED